MRRWIRHMLLFVLALAFVCGCKRIPLHERSTRVELKLNLKLDVDLELDLSYDTQLDEDFAMKLDGKEPEYMEVLFYDRYTHQLLLTQIVGPYGGVLDVPAGDYHMVAYNFGTESTQVEDLHHRLDAEAFTSDITKIMSSKFNAIQTNAPAESKSDVKGYETDPIIHEPDHLYVANKMDVTIPAFEGKEETVTIYADASTILEVYSLEVLNIKGAENIEKVDAFITGQIKSNYFGKQERNTNPATLYVTLKTDVPNNRLYTVFETFGKLPGEDFYYVP